MPRTLLSYVVAWSIWGLNAQTSSVGSFILVFCPFLIVKICAVKPYYTPSRSFTSRLYVASRVTVSWLFIETEELEGCVLFASPKQQETHRLRERNRTAKRASSMLDLTATTFSSRCSQALGARQRQREQHNDTTADVATAEATAQDVDVAPPQHPGSGSGLTPSVGSRGHAPVSVPGICNPEPRAPPASSSSLTSNSNDFNSKPLRLLHIAARNGTTGILLSLIKAGADVNSRDCSGTTPLHIAVRFRRASALELLVSHGANMNARDSANMTALEVAVRAQDEEHVNIPLSGGAELH
ncbi:ankyrin repeat-containing domain protein [Fusarium oxysporum]|nr:ankyrin repeat-containing domain protein [Fusarium oxysporum]